MPLAPTFGWLIPALALATACGASTHAWINGVGDCPAGTARSQDSDIMPTSWWCERPDGTMHGPTASVHDNGRNEHLGQYRNGRRHGRWVTFDANGGKIAEMSYRNGVRQGEWLSWYDDGARMQQHRYADGKRHGTWIEWWESGATRERRQFDHGDAHGRFAWWTRDSVLLRTEDYDHGRLLKTVRYVEGAKTVEISRISAP